MLDSSNDMQPFWGYVLNFVNDIINIVDIGPDGVRVGIVQFSNFARNILYLSNTTYSQLDLEYFVSNIPFTGGNRNVSGAILLTQNSQLTNAAFGDRPDVQNVVVFITAGPSNVDTTRTYSDSLNLRSIAKVFSVRINNLNNLAEAIALSSAPNQLNANYFLPSSTYLQSATYPLLTQACTYSGWLVLCYLLTLSGIYLKKKSVKFLWYF